MIISKVRPLADVALRQSVEREKPSQLRALRYQTLRGKESRGMTSNTFTLVHVSHSFYILGGVTGCRAFSKPRLFKIFDNYVNNSYNLEMPASQSTSLTVTSQQERERERAGKAGRAEDSLIELFYSCTIFQIKLTEIAAKTLNLM